MWSVLVVLSLIGCAVTGPPTTRSRAEIESFKTFLDKVRTDDGLTLEDRMASNPQAKPWENSGKYQGDIVLDDNDADSILKQYVEGRNAFTGTNMRWPFNTIIYEFASGFSRAQRNAVLAAMQTIERNTCIRFRLRHSERVFVRITGQNNGCYAHIGHAPSRGVHTFNLARSNPGTGCFHPQVIIHEWLHIAGFVHMQSTYNRDSYVRIFWNNIQQGMAHNFDRYANNVVNNLQLPYEYASNMHYGRTAFSRNGQATMTPIHNDNNLMGQLTHITNWDWLRARRLYNCPGAWSSPVEGQEYEESPQEDSEDLLQE